MNMFLVWTNIASRVTGFFASLRFFYPLNIPVIFGIKTVLGISLNDAKEKLSFFKSFQELFTRSLKTESRPIADSELVSPCDGRVQDSGDIKEGMQMTIKKGTYHLDTLLAVPNISLEDYGFVSIYLSPKDCHQYFMPQDAMIETVTHIPGYCLPVHPLMEKVLPTLFVHNERVVLRCSSNGQVWFMVMVAALNVGKIGIDCCPDLQSNSRKTKTKQDYHPNKELKKGDRVGQFELGSTIVLVLPKRTLAHKLPAQKKLLYGEAL